MTSISRLIRFLAQDGCTYYGDAIPNPGSSNIAECHEARVITGDIFGNHLVTDRVVGIHKLLSPLAPKDAGTVRCVGLNYEAHAKEANMSQPRYPLLFYKPRTALAGPFDPIRVPLMAQEGTSIDYECELVIVIGKKCRDVTEAQASKYIFGYAVGNDVTHREWQLKWGEGQWSHGKGFDSWAPYGPAIVTHSNIQDPQNLRIWTKVNGAILQDDTTAGMIFGASALVSQLSRGVTLMPGDLIFSGTPPGVGMCRSPQIWLKDGDIVEVGLEAVGFCINKVQFE